MGNADARARQNGAISENAESLDSQVRSERALSPARYWILMEPQMAALSFIVSSRL